MISVVIPLYNKEKAIIATLQSVLAQTYTDYEVVVVDDGSTDNSLKVVSERINELGNERIRVIHKENGGVSSARNRGIREAKGDFIALLDGDDLWEPTFLEEQVKLIHDFPNAAMWGVNTAFIKHGKCWKWQTGEWQYALIKPKIVVEKYLKDLGEQSLIDYKAQVFHGKVLDFFVCYNRDNDIAKADKYKPVCYDCYDPEWNRTEDITPEWHPQRQMIPAPKQLKRMIQMAEDCCKDFPYVRFDLYEINGNIIFGEMTFTSHGNVMNYYTEEYLVRTKDLL